MTPQRQRGFLLITAIVLIVVLAFFGMVVTFLASWNADAGSKHLESGQAFYVAESGLERARYAYNRERADCSELTYSGSVGQGSFSTGSATFYGPTSTTLSGAINSTDTTVSLTSTAGLNAAGRVRITSVASPFDFEDVDYTVISGNDLVGVTRGANGTTAAAHATGARVVQELCDVQESTGSVGTARRTVRERLVSPQAMMVYAKSNGDGMPYYRVWDGTAWSGERSATTVSANINYLVLKFARTRNEAILGTLSSNGQIRVQVWNGSSWSATTLLADIGGGGDAQRRAFDIEYESNSDRAIVVYADGGNSTPDYAIWDGSAWTISNADIDLSFTNDLRWVEMAPNPNSDEIALIAMDHGRFVSGARWTGSAWVSFGGTWGRTVDNLFKSIDVAYEQTSGRAMFIWGSDQDDDQEWRTWDGTTLGGVSMLTINAMGGPPAWIRLVPDYSPGSNDLMYVVQDDSSDLNTRFWDGAGWDGAATHPEHDSSTEDDEDRNFDFVFETAVANRGTGWLVWGNGSTLSARRWSGAGWDATTTLGGDDTALVQMIALPKSGTILGGVYQDSSSSTDDIDSFDYRQGVLGATAIWNGPVVGNPVHERVFLATERFIPEVAWEEVFP